MDLTPERIFNLFFKFPITHIPITSQETICSFISKAKTLREASDTGFFKRNLADLLKNTFDRNDSNQISQFFTHIDKQKNLKVIPTIQLEDMSIQILDIHKFNTMFRPIIELVDEHFRQILEKLNLAFLILNSRNEIIYQNKSVTKLHKFLAKETGARKKSILDYFPKSFYQNIIDASPEKIYNLRTSNQLLKYKVQYISINHGRVNLVYFLT